jgi:hypothetical protein
MPKQNKSPLTSAPLRNPGQSLDAQIDDLGLDMLQPFLVATMLVVLAILEWFRWYRDFPPHPILYSLVAVVGILYTIVQTRRYLSRLRALRQGRDGEKAVGQYLEQVRDPDARVFHDLVADDFNLDHVLVTTKGIFAIETKTWSKPVRGEANITYDGEDLFANGQKRDRDPVKQANAQARWLGNLIKESTGKAFPIRPVVVFPGWYVNSTATMVAKSKGVWLLNPKALPDFIGAERASMTAEDVRLVSYHLGRSIRAVK